MIQIKEYPDKSFETKEQMFKFLRENKNDIIAQKKMQTKHADAFSHTVMFGEKINVFKDNQVNESSNLKAKLVINTTNILDSHGDVHLKGIWKKTLKEQKNLYLLQEHRLKFDHIITDKVKAKTEIMKWSELGQKYTGETEALIFDVEISKERNPYMHGQYAKGYVRNHSVGMRYVKILLAINSDSKWNVEEKEVWDKYINEIVNKEQAEAKGYFWAVLEAKIIEGSAVPIGSNTVTPTISTEAVKDTSTPVAEKSLHEQQSEFFNNLI